MNWRWWKRVEEETKSQVEEAQKAAETGADRLAEVREIADKSAVVRKEDQSLRERNRFVQTFWRVFEEGLR